MKTTCTNYGKKYQQSEAYENTYDRPALCLRCALIELTADDDFDQEPEWIDIENAWSRSGQMQPEEEREIWEEQRRYPDQSDDEENPEWCHYCNGYQCECSARQKEEAEREREDNFNYLYDEAYEEDQNRTREAEQAVWDAEIAEWERIEAEHEADEKKWLEAYWAANPWTWSEKIRYHWYRIKYYFWH